MLALTWAIVPLPERRRKSRTATATSLGESRPRLEVIKLSGAPGRTKHLRDQVQSKTSSREQGQETGELPVDPAEGA
jgi:hypothetical protein